MAMNYSAKVMDHFTNPRNMGKIENASGCGTVGNAVCGDIMRVYLDIDDNQVIQDAKFKTYGCTSAIASSSLVTELIKGKTLEEAEQLKNTAIAEELELPPVKIHCSILAEDAIKAAVEDYRHKQAQIKEK